MEETNTSDSKPSIALRCAFIALIGLLDSIYLLYHHVEVKNGFQRGPSLCNVGDGFNCDAIVNSSYSELFGLPLGAYGTLFYIFLLYYLMFFQPLRSEAGGAKRSFSDSLFFLFFAAFLSSVVLFGISYFLIGQICLFCCLIYLVNLLLLLLSFRDPNRSTSVVGSLLNGVSSLFRLLFTFKTGVNRGATYVLGLWLLVLVSAYLVIQTPDLLLTKVFEPRESREALSFLIKRWEESPKYEIPVVTEGPVEERDYVVGDSDAKITLVEFSDFECPYCQRAAAVLKPYALENPSKVRVVFKNYPLDGACNPLMQGAPHKFACFGAILARCAGYHGEESFWKMHDALFALQREEWSLESLIALTKDFGANSQVIETCVIEEKSKPRVLKDVELGNTLKLQGTPSMFVNGRAFEFGRLELIPRLLDLISEDLG